MSLPNVADVCVQLDLETGLDARLAVDLPVALADLKVTLPGGVNLQAKATQGIPNPGDITADLLAQLNTALAPFQPIFDLIDIALASVKVFDAVKSLNPLKIGQELVKLIAKVDVVAAYIVPLSIPKTIGGALDAILVFLAGLKASLTLQVEAQLRLDAAEARAAALEAKGPDGAAIAAELRASIACGQANLDASFAAQAASAGPLNRLLALLSGLAEVAGLPALPTLSMTGNAAATLDALDVLIAALSAARAAIVV